MKAILATVVAGLGCGLLMVSAQNIVELSGQTNVLPAIAITVADWERAVREVPVWNARITNSEARRVAAKLEAHVTEFLAGYPWRPLHHTLGISGHETLFGHPDEMFYALALALPHVSAAAQKQIRQFINSQLQAGVFPFAVEGPDLSQGKAREVFEVPPGYRTTGRARATSGLGFYSFWLWCHVSNDAVSARQFWPQIKAAAHPLLTGKYAFDITKKDYGNDEAEQLNGRLAGLIGYVRLAQLNGDQAAVDLAKTRGRQWLEWRVNLERVNPKILEKSTRSASKSLHNFKLARYCGLVPETAAALERHAPGIASGRLTAFRTGRNGWYLAFGDRLVGGENYTNPLHFSRALFAGAALLENVPPEWLLAWVDVPWCRGDYYFMEKCALALWRSGDGPVFAPPAQIP